jgi:aminoglycoside 3-N-acetyltransferase
MEEHETEVRLARDLEASGLRRGGLALVHSSLSALGYVPGGPETVIRALLSALGPEGTLLLPALSYEHANPQRPFFDVLHTPSNVGAIPEYFRTRPGTLRSVCPTHSVCGVGPQAHAALDEHALDDTPCGPRSPFRRLRDLGGQVVFLGCGLRPNTSMHGVEELAQPPYLFGDMVTYRIRWPDGHESEQRCRAHDFRGWAQRYDRVSALLKVGEELKIGRALQAEVHILEAPALWARALAALAEDKLHFVERRD